MVQNNQGSRRKYWATCSSIRLLARTAHLFPCSTLLASLLRSLTLELVRKWMIRWLFLLFLLLFWTIVRRLRLRAWDWGSSIFWIVKPSFSSSFSILLPIPFTSFSPISLRIVLNLFPFIFFFFFCFFYFFFFFSSRFLDKLGVFSVRSFFYPVCHEPPHTNSWKLSFVEAPIKRTSPIFTWLLWWSFLISAISHCYHHLFLSLICFIRFSVFTYLFLCYSEKQSSSSCIPLFLHLFICQRHLWVTDICLYHFQRVSILILPLRTLTRSVISWCCLFFTISISNDSCFDLFSFFFLFFFFF